MLYSFPKSKRLLTSRDFRPVKRGKSLVGKWLVLDVVPSREPNSRLGLAASKRYGNACKRNRFKRVVREAFRKLDIEENFDIVARPRKAALDAGYEEIASEMRALLKSY